VDVRKAIIPAAGWGTRLLPASKAIPKEMLPVVDRPGIQYIVEEAVASRLKEIILVTGKGKGCIEDHFDIQGELEDILERKSKKELLATVRESPEWSTSSRLGRRGSWERVTRYCARHLS